MTSKFLSISSFDFQSLKNLKDNNSLQNFFSIKNLVAAFGWLSLFAAVWLATYIGELFKKSDANVLPPPFELLTENQNPELINKPNLDSFKILTSSQLFGKPKPIQTQNPNTQISSSTSKLRLVAVSALSNGRKLAIIEDTNKQNQEVFEVNETVFNQGKIADIANDSVKIEVNGRIETLVLQDVNIKSLGSSSSPTEISDNQTDFSVEEEELSAALNNLPQLLSQARAVPYFRNGQSIGMRLFAIRSGSMYEKLGLKNGDIILAVNDNSLSDPAEALKLFEQLKNERSIGVKLERNSQPLSMQYTIR